MAPRLGVRINPHILGDLFKVNARMSLDGGLAIRLAEGGIPPDHCLVHAGIDRETGEFFLIFSAPGTRASEPVTWKTPIYEKEEGDAVNP